MPVQTGFFPFLEPFEFGTGADEKLHFHLLEFTHTENKLPGNNFVAESFSCLCNPERDFHPAGFLYVQVIYKNALGGFRTKVNNIGIFAHRTH